MRVEGGRAGVSTGCAVAAGPWMHMELSAFKVSWLRTPYLNLPAAVKTEILCCPIFSAESQSLTLLTLIVALDVCCARVLLLYPDIIDNHR